MKKKNGFTPGPVAEISFEEIISRLDGLDLPAVDLVVGVGTSGGVPASLVAYKLGCEVRVLEMNYRDENNQPRYPSPKLMKKFSVPSGVKSILLVDDVSVSGKTLSAARKILKGLNVKTLVLKGSADYVAFPEIKECVIWPWKKMRVLRPVKE